MQIFLMSIEVKLVGCNHGVDLSLGLIACFPVIKEGCLFLLSLLTLLFLFLSTSI